MRLAHKRNVQLKLQKRVKVSAAQTSVAPKSEKPAVKKAAVKSAPAAATASVAKTQVTLTPKQQQVLDIVVANAEGINSKGVGLAAGQEESKAASWASGALKKLTEENLVEKLQLSGNKVIYKAI